MKLSFRELFSHLTKTIKPLYLISGDEILLVQDALESIRQALRKQGFSERVLITPETGTRWENVLFNHSQSLSLFSEKKFIELNLSELKLSAATGKILEEYATKPPENTVLIIRAPKYDARMEKSNWFKAIDKLGVIIQIWPIALEQLPQWVIDRAKKSDLTITKQAAEKPADLVQGNLLAAATEIEKLKLLQNDAVIDEKIIENAVIDSAHFDIFNLVDMALMGNRSQCIRILESLKAEAVEPPLILWAFTRELRILADLQNQIKSGVTLSSLFPKYRIWEKRQPYVRTFLQRHSEKTLGELFIKAAFIDRLIKGVESGNVWHALTHLGVKMCHS